MLHILISTGPNLPVPAIRGGAVNRFWEQVSSKFAERGHKVSIFSRASANQLPQEVCKGVVYSRSGGFELSRKTWINYARTLIYAIRTCQRLPSADIYVTNDVFSPWLMVVRGLSKHTVVAVGRAPKAHFRFYPRVLSFAAPTQAIRRAIIRRSAGLTNSTVVLPYAIDTSVFSPPKCESASRRDRLLFVGRLHPEKGLDLLLQAFAKISSSYHQLQLVVAGPSSAGDGGGGGDYLQDLKSRYRGLAITWLEPNYDPSALAELYRSCGWFVYPSLAEKGETFGVAVLEAMASGCVPIVSSLECFRDFVQPGVNGYVFDHSAGAQVEALSSALRVALDSSRLMVARSARTTAESFDLESVADQWIAHFSRMSNQPK